MTHSAGHGHQPGSSPLLLEAAIAQAQWVFHRLEQSLWDADPVAIDRIVNELLEAVDWAMQTAAHAARLSPDLADRIGCPMAASRATKPAER